MSASGLREGLRVRAEQWAHRTGLPSYRSIGQPPTVLFRPTDDGKRHGNFFGDAWLAIGRVPGWRIRLDKPHQTKKALRPEDRPAAKELDSSNSSDALLMNCFCPPGAANRIAAALGYGKVNLAPTFGVRPGVALRRGGDRTEIDMVLPDLLVEAKLTERDFTSRPREHVQRYEDVESVFDLDRLAVEGTVRGFQLIRNVLAARQRDAQLLVLVDARRADLMAEWERVHASVIRKALRDRCHLRTWQEVAAALTGAHRAFLVEKYGL